MEFIHYQPSSAADADSPASASSPDSSESSCCSPPSSEDSFAAASYTASPSPSYIVFSANPASFSTASSYRISPYPPIAPPSTTSSYTTYTSSYPPIASSSTTASSDATVPPSYMTVSYHTTFPPAYTAFSDPSSVSFASFASTPPSFLINPSAPSTQVDKSSLYGIARQHCREEILIAPIRWTGRHLELLQCSFEQPTPEPVTAASYASSEEDCDKERSGAQHLEDFFKFYYKAPFRVQGIRLLLTADKGPLVAFSSLGFYLNGFVAKMLDCLSLCLRSSMHPSIEYKRPLAALIDRDEIELSRKNSIGYRSIRFNRPIVWLYNMKWKKIRPPEPLNDPYIVSLLIGVAQQKRLHFLELNCRPEDSEGNIFSQVLCTYNSRGESAVKGEEAQMGWLYLYQANIPLSLLDMFDKPKVAPPSNPSVSVQIVQIRYWPLSTLRARLLEIMLPEKLASETHSPSTEGGKRKYDDQGEAQPSAREPREDEMHTRQQA